jgi:hypothetical protein
MIEAKNSQLKHGVELQAAVTIYVVNIKRFFAISQL